MHGAVVVAALLTDTHRQFTHLIDNNLWALQHGCIILTYVLKGEVRNGCDWPGHARGIGLLAAILTAVLATILKFRKGGGTYGLYRSQPPGEDRDVLASLLGSSYVYIICLWLQHVAFRLYSVQTCFHSKIK